MKQLSPSPEAAAVALGVPLEIVRERLGARMSKSRRPYASGPLWPAATLDTITLGRRR